ncbi:hypothetical protein MBLNU459_g3951t1 [Dothideomycetes sp. NU459]
MCESRPSTGSEISSGAPLAAEEEGIFVGLTHNVLDAVAIMNKVRSPKAGAIVLFAGTTRDNFANKPVVHLAYEAYAPLALRTMSLIARELKTKHELNGIAMIHRLGVVPIAEESILIAVSTPHRQAAWRAGEEALELVKEKVEVWKLEEFGGEEGGVWRANRDGQMGSKVSDGSFDSARVESDAEVIRRGDGTILQDRGNLPPNPKKKMLEEDVTAHRPRKRNEV